MITGGHTLRNYSAKHTSYLCLTRRAFGSWKNLSIQFKLNVVDKRFHSFRRTFINKAGWFAENQGTWSGHVETNGSTRCIQRRLVFLSGFLGQN